MTATVVSEPPDSAKVIFGGRRVTRGFQFQVTHWREAKSIARKVITKLTPIVAATRCQNRAPIEQFRPQESWSAWRSSTSGGRSQTTSS